MSISGASTTKRPDVAESRYTPNISGDIIDVKVGGTKIFHVHKGILASAPFFQTAMKPKKAQAQTKRPIELDDEDPEIFKQSLMHDEFQDAVIDVFMTRSIGPNSKFPGAGAVNVIYNGTNDGSPARRLMVDFVCWAGQPNWIHEDASAIYHKDFVNDAFFALLAHRGLPDLKTRPWLLKPATYHLHNGNKGVEDKH